MKKGDLILTIVMRSDKSRTEEQIRKELASLLIDCSLNIDEWDKVVPAPIANAMLTT